MFRKTIKDEEYVLYENEKEFTLYEDSLVKYWKDGEEGDWVRSDDGKICKILKKGIMKKKPYIRCLMGTHFLKDDMSGDPPKNIYSLSRNEYASDVRLKREKANDKEWVFAKYVATGMDPTDAYLKAFSSKSKEYANIRNIVSNEIKKTMDNLGITEDYLLAAAKTVIEDTDKDADRVRAIRMLMEIRNMFPKESNKSESLTVFQGFSRDQLEALKDARSVGQIEAEIPDN
jgi:ElaB/YqjD/DUF883 family membrane-anchored ribosome-binding protein